MRRMLDPKELGGGGGSGEPLYLHSIYLSNSLRNAVMVQIYSHSSTQFTIDSLKKWLSNKTYPCSGAITGGDHQYIPFHIHDDSSPDSLSCDTIDLANHSDMILTLASWRLTDRVFPIE